MADISLYWCAIGPTAHKRSALGQRSERQSALLPLHFQDPISGPASSKVTLTGQSSPEDAVLDDCTSTSASSHVADAKATSSPFEVFHKEPPTNAVLAL